MTYQVHTTYQYGNDIEIEVVDFDTRKEAEVHADIETEWESTVVSQVLNSSGRILSKYTGYFS